jgi:signal transduction histidine kinase
VAVTSLGERLVARVVNGPGDRREVLRDDALLAAALIALSIPLALLGPAGHRPDALGWVLLVAGQVPLVWRRRYPLPAVAAMIALLGPYHGLDYTHTAAVPGSMVLLYTFAANSRPRRTIAIGVVVISAATFFNLASTPQDAAETLKVSGWIVAVLIAGANTRVYRHYLVASRARAERAERSREDEAARRVAEERLRIARDLHDLLAHSITLIGVRTGVAAHLLTADPQRLDVKALAGTLDEVAGVCQSARAQLRTTLEVLREAGPGDGPLPDMSGLPDLAEAAGARLTVHTDDRPIPPAVAAATYRIVQEALTNAARHAGPDAKPEVTVEAHGAALHVSITDSGVGAGAAEGVGFGLIGMRERVRSVGGTITAGPRPERGFGVTAVLPLTGSER